MTAFSGGTKALSSRTLDIAGSATWTAGTITLLGAAINNLAGATFDAQADTSLSGTGTFNNNGTFRRSGANGDLEIDVEYVNAGRVEVQTGTFILESGSDSTGSFIVAAGATLDFGLGGHNLSPDSSVTSAGTVRFMSLMRSQSGTANVAGSYTVTGDTIIQDEVVNFLRDVTLPTLTLRRFQSTTVLGGPADVTITGLLTWTGATMSGSGRTRANGGIVTGTFQPGDLVGRTLDNAGTAIWTDQGLPMFQGATFNNLAGATFLMQDDRHNEIGWSQSNSRFNNAGTFIKLASYMETVISANFVNNGTVEVRTGSLTLSTGSTSSGSYEVDSGSVLTFGSGFHTLTPGSSVTGTGSVWFRAGFGQTSATALAGVYDVSGTTTMISGSAEFLSGARMGNLNLGSGFDDPPGTITGPGDLSITGTFSWTGGTLAGSGRLRANGGMSITTGVAALRLDGRVLESPRLRS